MLMTERDTDTQQLTLEEAIGALSFSICLIIVTFYKKECQFNIIHLLGLSCHCRSSIPNFEVLAIGSNVRIK